MGERKGGAAVGEVLLVEDTPMNQKVEKAMLECCGCRVDVAGNGLEALEILRGRRYDLIFMDCQMPGLDGYATTRAIRAQEAAGGGRTPIVALTAFAMEGDRERCLAAGMDDHLGKPFNIPLLQRKVGRWFGVGGDAVVGGATDAGGMESSPPLSGGAGAPAVDRDPLDRLAALEGAATQGTLRRIVALYLEQSERLLAALRAAVDAGDADGMGRAAHTLKSSSASLGALALSGLCRELETMGRRGSLAGADAILTSLEGEYPRVRTFLEAYAAALP